MLHKLLRVDCGVMHVKIEKNDFLNGLDASSCVSCVIVSLHCVTTMDASLR